MRTFVEVLRDNAVYADKAYTFVRYDGEERRISFRQMWQIACQRASKLRQLGLRKGDRVAIILPEPDTFVMAFIGALTGGLVPVPMYPPLTLAKMEAYGDTVRHILRASGAKALVTVPGLSAMLAPHLVGAADGADVMVIDETELMGPLPERPQAPCQLLPTDLAFLQFTSGSTRKPKGVMVTHANLSANAHAIMFDGLRVNRNDRGVSWLPLYHDMGLIGFVIAPLFAQIEVKFLPTLNFIRRPALWLDAIDEFRASITFAPNFAYALAARAIKQEQSKAWDLSCVKAFGCGAEPILPDTIQSFLSRFADNGLKPETILPCYGLAEATLAVAFAGIDEPLKVDVLDSEKMKDGLALPSSVGRTTEVVSCGHAFPGHELAIVDDQGTRLGDRQVGEVLLRGPSVTQGYFRAEAETAQVFRNGWLHTGDLGYLVDGELFVCGRAKDLIIVNGKNYYPQDVERIAARVHGVRPDQAIAFARRGANGSEHCVVVIEVVKGDNDIVQGAAAIIQRVRTDLGVPVAEVVFIERNSMPKTSSGKVRRRETKARLAARGLSFYQPPARPPTPPLAAPRPSRPTAP